MHYFYLMVKVGNCEVGGLLYYSCKLTEEDTRLTEVAVHKIS